MFNLNSKELEANVDNEGQQDEELQQSSYLVKRPAGYLQKDTG